MKLFVKIITAVTLITVLMAGMFSVSTSALGSDYTVYNSDKIYLPETYAYVDTISGIDSAPASFSSPGDLFIDGSDNMYIADTGNNRIVKLDKNGKFLFEIAEWGDAQALLNPTCVFADEKGDIYITDTGNYRIVVFDKNGKYLRELGKPSSDLLKNLTIYMPDSVIFSDKTRYMYVIAGKQLLTIDKDNYFQGYLGAEPVKFSLKNFLVRRFGSQTQIDNLKQSEPVSYQNVCLNNGNIYAVTLGKKNNIKVLNGIGNNIFPSGNYGETTVDMDTQTVAEPDFQDIAVDPSGNILVAQKNNSRIYAYDNDGNMLFSFGGKGDTAGNFEEISSIAINSKGHLYILDSVQNSIQIMRPTYFTEKVFLGNDQYLDGKYEEAMETWTEIASLCPGYVLAHRKIGDVLFKQKDFEAAADAYMKAKDSGGYAKAYDKISNKTMKKYFALAALGLAALLLGFYFLTNFYKKWSKKVERKLYFETMSPTKTFLYLIPFTMFHPVMGFDRIKYNRKKIPYWLCLLILLTVPVVCVIKVAFGNYAVSGITIRDTSLFYESAIILGPLLLWVILSYLCTSLMSGEATIGETIAAACYSLLPWIVFTPVLTGISYFVGADNLVFFKGAELLLLVWVIAYLLLALGNMNDYSLGKTILVTFISLFGMIVVCLAALLLSSLTVQLIDQVAKLINEFNTLKM